MLNRQESEITLQVPAREAPPQAKGAEIEPGWSIDIAVSTALTVDTNNAVGVREDALPWFDRHDRAEAPLTPGDAIALYFPHAEWRRHGGPSTTDFRPEPATKSGAWSRWRRLSARRFACGESSARQVS